MTKLCHIRHGTVGFALEHCDGHDCSKADTSDGRAEDWSHDLMERRMIASESRGSLRQSSVDVVEYGYRI